MISHMDSLKSLTVKGLGFWGATLFISESILFKID